MELYLKLIDVLFPVFFVIGVGYYLGKKDPKWQWGGQRRSRDRNVFTAADEKGAPGPAHVQRWG